MDFTKRRWLIFRGLLPCQSLHWLAVCVERFAAPMAAHIQSVTGGEAPNLSIIFTIANAVGPITMISGGFFNDKLGPKWVGLLGGVLFGAGMIFSGIAQSVPVLLLTYGLGVGLGVGLVYGCTVSNSVKFFPDKRGLVGGISYGFLWDQLGHRAYSCKRPDRTL